MNSGHSITKRYSNLKAAHRQWRHPGHCSFVHGENWTFDITFKADSLDKMNFVVDFGKLHAVRDFLDKQFDHTLLIDMDDPQKAFFERNASAGVWDVRFVPSASAEGLAEYVLRHVNTIIAKETEGRVSVAKVVCFEDEKNSAEFVA